MRLFKVYYNKYFNKQDSNKNFGELFPENRPQASDKNILVTCSPVSVFPTEVIGSEGKDFFSHQKEINNKYSIIYTLSIIDLIPYTKANIVRQI